MSMCTKLKQLTGTKSDTQYLFFFSYLHKTDILFFHSEMYLKNEIKF